MCECERRYSLKSFVKHAPFSFWELGEGLRMRSADVKLFLLGNCVDYFQFLSVPSA